MLVAAVCIEHPIDASPSLYDCADALRMVLQDMYSEIPVPKSLKDSRNFDFLQRDLRRTTMASDG